MTVYDEILQELQAAQARGAPVRALNVYKGLPVTNSVQILKVEGKLVTIQLNKYQATCLELQRQTFLDSDSFSHVVRGSVVTVDLMRETAVLTGLIYMAGEIGHRLAVRVQPKDPLGVEMLVKGHNLRAQLVDLSITGIGITTGALLFGPTFFTRETPITVTLPLPIPGGPVKVLGTIANIRKDLNTLRIGVSTQPDSKARALLTQYVSMRQAEIQRELRMVQETFYRLASGEEEERT